MVKKKADNCEVINCLMLAHVVEHFAFSPFGNLCSFFVAVCQDHCRQIHDIEFAKHLPDDILICSYEECYKLITNPDEFVCIIWKTLSIAGEIPISARSFFCENHYEKFKQQADENDITIDE